MIRVFRRRLVNLMKPGSHFEEPREKLTANWLEQAFRTCFLWREVLPDFIVSDRDGIFGDWLGRCLLDCYGIRLYRTPPRSLNCNAFIEAWNGTIREELLDRRIFFGRRDLQRVVNEYVAYYNERRHHQSLDLNTPIQKLIPKSILTVKRSAEIESLMVLSSITDSLPE